MQKSVFTFKICVIVSLLGSLLGCEPATEGRVSGTITFNGTPLNSGWLMFENVDGSKRTDAGFIKDGTYVAESVTFGEKLVRVAAMIPKPGIEPNALDPNSYNALPLKYGVNSELRVVVDKADVIHNFELTP